MPLKITEVYIHSNELKTSLNIIKLNLNDLQKMNYIYFGPVNAHWNLNISTVGHCKEHKDMTDALHIPVVMALRRSKASWSPSICVLPEAKAAAALM